MKSTDKVPTGNLQRAGIMGAAGIKVGTSKLKHAAKKLVLDKESRESEKSVHDEKIADILFESLQKLKGTALKAAQILSMEMDILPEPLRVRLSKACYQVPPMSEAMARRVLFSEFSQPPNRIFARIDAKAFAAASLGQVHEAKSHQGQKLAVKIQYPGIGESITNDMKIIRSVVKAASVKLKKIFKPQAINVTLKEIENHLLEEIDYEMEAENTCWFYHRLKDWKNIVIPEVFQEWTTPIVLTTRKLEGLHLKEWMATNPSQKERDYYGQLFVDLFYHCIFDLEKINADPNPGNFFFMPGGKLGVVDFGCIQSFDQNFLKYTLQAHQGYLEKDFTAIFAGLYHLGMLPEIPGKKSEPAMVKLFEPVQEIMALIYGAEKFNFSNNPGLIPEFDRICLEPIKVLENNPLGQTYYNRTIRGLFRILESLGANVCLKINRT